MTEGEYDMEDSTQIILELLSAGVMAALVTGMFSLIISVKNNRKLYEMEKNKQIFTMQQERYKQLLECFNILKKEIPDENTVGHVIMNFEKNSVDLEKILLLAEDNISKIYKHYQHYSHLFEDSYCNEFEASIENLDNISKNVHNLLYDYENNIDEIKELQTKRIIVISEIIDNYFKMIKTQLSVIIKMR